MGWAINWIKYCGITNLYYLLTHSPDLQAKIKEYTAMFHCLGMIVWHDVPKLRDIVVVDSQWLADAMAGVVSFVFQTLIAQSNGMVSWNKLHSSIKLQYENLWFVYFI